MTGVRGKRAASHSYNLVFPVSLHGAMNQQKKSMRQQITAFLTSFLFHGREKKAGGPQDNTGWQTPDNLSW
jgi:hypothetical protein